MTNKIKNLTDLKRELGLRTKYDELKWSSEFIFDLIKELPSWETDDVIEGYKEIVRSLNETPQLETSDTESFHRKADIDELNKVLSVYRDELHNRRVPIPK